MLRVSHASGNGVFFAPGSKKIKKIRKSKRQTFWIDKNLPGFRLRKTISRDLDDFSTPGINSEKQ